MKLPTCKWFWPSHSVEFLSVVLSWSCLQIADPTCHFVLYEGNFGHLTYVWLIHVLEHQNILRFINGCNTNCIFCWEIIALCIFLNLDIFFFLSSQGIRLFRETDGSLTVTRLGKNDVIVKGYQDPANHCISGEVVMREGRLPVDQPMKVTFLILTFHVHWSSPNKTTLKSTNGSLDCIQTT